jgi:hypothetical protein
MSSGSNNEKASNSSDNHAEKRTASKPIELSPKKPKAESKKTDDSGRVFARIITDHMGIIGSYSSRNHGDDAFLAYAGNLAKDADGLFIKKQKDKIVKTIRMENLRTKGIVDYKYRRVDMNSNEILRSTRSDSGKYWGRHVFVVMSSKKLTENLWMSAIVEVIEVNMDVAYIYNNL